MHFRIFTAGRFLLPTLALAVLALANAPAALANHAVFVEGNCAGGPSSGSVPAGACGDYDMDGRIGVLEDTDPPDNVFGTLNVALGPNGVNGNGRVIIVKSGTFTEAVNAVTNAAINITLGTGHIQIEAAHGVEANIDAVLPGNPDGNNNVRQEAIGLNISGPAGSSVTLRNLTVRNWMIGMRMGGAVRVKVEHCHFDNNRDYGIQVQNSSRITMNNSEIAHTGRRQGSNPVPSPGAGTGIQFADTSGGYLNDSVITNSTRFGVQNTAGNVVLCHVALSDNDGGNTSGPNIIVLCP